MHYLKNWSEEKSSAYLYLIVARQENDAVKKKLFQELAKVAEKQAAMWAAEMKKEGGKPPRVYYPDLRTRVVGLLLRYFNIQQLRFILSAMKVRGMSVYGDTLTSHSHAFPSGSAKLEKRHKGLNTAGNLRAAVFGVNDGLVSNLSLLLGLVGGGANSHALILSGVAGLLAGSCSMAAGEYVSMRSQREFFEYQIALEKEELDLYPEEEAAELAHIYHARGLPKKEAKELADRMINNPEKALDTLAREELGLNPNELGSPWGAACASFISFSLGALIPLIPFFFGNESVNLTCSLVLTAFTLFGIGATLSLFTNLSAIFGGLRMLGIGAAAGSLTYLIGKLVGVTLGV
jgi:VIT1/CCC1 family predicted Fe2+/Mn2+ transporter